MRRDPTSSPLPEARHLGQRSGYPESYDPSLLVAVPRAANRLAIGIEEPGRPPFVGVDAWHAYEVSGLFNTGLPFVCLLKIVYPCTSPAIVESKSLKLYLLSLSRERFGDRVEEAMLALCERVRGDLSSLLSTEVLVAPHVGRGTGFDFADYGLVEEVAGTPAALESAGGREVRLASHLLRSRCRITGQPDWGTIYVRAEGSEAATPASLLNTILKVRDEMHFHEEMCEGFFVALLREWRPSRLMVATLYTRRGGIDINPVRSLDAGWLPPLLPEARCLTEGAWRQ